VPASPPVGFRLSPDLRERAEDRARRERRPLSSVIRLALEAHLSDRVDDRREPTDGAEA
jgi:predicted DNA-binding protein